MIGYLVPCGGGKTIVMTKPRLLFGRRKTASDTTVPAVHDIELRFVDGWWYVRKLSSERPLHINGIDTDSARLNPDDLISIGGRFFRITFQPPASESNVPLQSLDPDSRRPTVTNADVGFQLGLLVPCGGGPSVNLLKSRVVIGRSPACDLVINDRDVSSRHCTLELINGYWQVVDLESKNGTTVDGMAYRKKWILSGCILGLARKRFRLEYQPKGECPTLADDDEIIPPKRSLTELVGLNHQRLDRLLKSLPSEEPSRPRWSLDG